MSSSSTRLVLVVLIGVVACASVIVASLHTARPEGVEVETAVVERRSMDEVVEATGRVRPRLEVDVSPQVIARVERVLVEEGEEVARGAVLVELDRAAIAAACDRAAAQLSIEKLRRKGARLRRDAAVGNSRALVELGRTGVVSDHEVTLGKQEVRAAEYDLLMANLGVEQVAVDLQAAEEQLVRATVVAPISGTVVVLGVRAGETVVPGSNGAPGSVIATIADTTFQDVHLDVDEVHIGEIEIGQRAEAEVDAMRQTVLSGKVRAIATSGARGLDRLDATVFAVAIALDEPQPSLRPEMSASARILVASHPSAIAVPIEAVLRTPDGTGDAVFIVEDDIAHLRRVELGIADLSHVEIVGGVSENDVVIVGPYRLMKVLRDGERVVVDDDGGRNRGGRPP